jgi:hypothetical protein
MSRSLFQESALSNTQVTASWRTLPGIRQTPRPCRAVPRLWRQFGAGVALLLALSGPPALAATIPVDGTTCTLVDAIRAANRDQPWGGCPAGSGADTLVLAAGSTHTLNQIQNTTFGPTGMPVITSRITIAGNGSTIERESSAPAFRIVTVGATEVLTLQQITVRGGGATGPFPANAGGGVWNTGRLTLRNCTLAGNSAMGFFSGGGGAVYNSASGTLTVTNSTLTDNSAFLGGGVRNDGTLTLTNSTLAGNSADFDGGGVWNGKTLTLHRTLIAGNTPKTARKCGTRVRSRPTTLTCLG